MNKAEIKAFKKACLEYPPGKAFRWHCNMYIPNSLEYIVYSLANGEMSKDSL